MKTRNSGGTHGFIRDDGNGKLDVKDLGSINGKYQHFTSTWNTNKNYQI